MDIVWYRYLEYNHIKHFWKNVVVDRLNRHGIHFISFSDERIKRYSGRKIMSKGDLNKTISEMIDSGTPFLISRLGGTETKYSTSFISGKNKENALNQLEKLSGFFPHDIKLADRFAEMYIRDIGLIDICGIWRYFMEDYMLDVYGKQASLSILEWLEPWRTENDEVPWTHSLKGKKVLVIHPFSESIRRQYYEKRQKIFSNRYNEDDILPPMNLITLTAIQSLGGQGTDGYKTWFDALDNMIKKVSEIDFDVAIVGCGAYGLPLSAEIKRMGKQAIHLGGATQLLFGIMGGRWENTPEIASLQNDAWIRPTEKETPRSAMTVENGCYW